MMQKEVHAWIKDGRKREIDAHNKSTKIVTNIFTVSDFSWFVKEIALSTNWNSNGAHFVSLSTLEALP